VYRFLTRSRPQREAAVGGVFRKLLWLNGRIGGGRRQELEAWLQVRHISPSKMVCLEIR